MSSLINASMIPTVPLPMKLVPDTDPEVPWHLVAPREVRWNMKKEDVSNDPILERAYEFLYDMCVGWHPRDEFARQKRLKNIQDISTGYDETGRLKQFYNLVVLDEYVDCLIRRDIAGNTLLHLAAGSGLSLMVRLLLEAECNVTKKNKLGLTPMMVALQKDKPDLALMMLSVERYLPGTRNNEILERIPDLEEFAQTLKRIVTCCTSDDKWKVLAMDYGIKAFTIHHTSKLEEKLKELLFWIISQPKECVEGFYLLCLIIDITLERGLRYNENLYKYPHPKAFYTITEAAYCLQYRKISTLLNMRGLKIDRKKLPINLGVFLSATRGDLKKLRFFVRSGGDVNKKAKWFDKMTPLHITAARGYIDCSLFLLEHMANCLLEDNKGRLPAQMALKNNYSNLYIIIRRQEELMRLSYSPSALEVEKSSLEFPGTLQVQVFTLLHMETNSMFNRMGNIFAGKDQYYMLLALNEEIGARSLTMEVLPDSEHVICPKNTIFTSRIESPAGKVKIKIYKEPDEFIGSIPLVLILYRDMDWGAKLTIPLTGQESDDALALAEIQTVFLSDRARRLGLPPVGWETKQRLLEPYEPTPSQSSSSHMGHFEGGLWEEETSESDKDK